MTKCAECGCENAFSGGLHAPGCSMPLAQAIQRARWPEEPVERALLESDQRRSFVQGQTGHASPSDILADEVRRLRTENAALKAENLEALAIAEALGMQLKTVEGKDEPWTPTLNKLTTARFSAIGPEQQLIRVEFDLLQKHFRYQIKILKMRLGWANSNYELIANDWLGERREIRSNIGAAIHAAQTANDEKRNLDALLTEAIEQMRSVRGEMTAVQNFLDKFSERWREP